MLLSSQLPEKPGVYFLKSKRGKILYIGKAKNLKKRVVSYFQKKKFLESTTRQLISKVKSVDYIEVNYELEAFLLEAYLIRKKKPFYNIKLKDDKSYPLIRISKEKWPQVSVVREEKKGNFYYYGPYPKGLQLKKMVRFLRKVFMFRTCKKIPKKACLYYEINMCMGACLKKRGIKKKYQENIKLLRDFLEGKTKAVADKLREKRDKQSEKLNYEEAALIQEKINIIEELLKKIYLPEDYIENPNLVYDLRKKEIEKLISFLKKNGFKVEKLDRIEGYDISQIGNEDVVGTMVVFEKGEELKRDYKRFRIRGEKSDSKALGEVLKRRRKHKNWGRADLIVIDGGRAQLSEIKKEIKEVNILAFEKKGDKIYGLRKKGGGISYSKLKGIDKQAINLLKRVRDEAHRFAISYHRKLRKMRFDREILDLLR